VSGLAKLYYIVHVWSREAQAILVGGGVAIAYGQVRGYARRDGCSRLSSDRAEAHQDRSKQLRS